MALFYGPNIDPATGLPFGMKPPASPEPPAPAGPSLGAYLPSLDTMLTLASPFLPQAGAYKLGKWVMPRVLGGIGSAAERLGGVVQDPGLRMAGQRLQEAGLGMETPAGPRVLDVEEARDVEQAKQQQAQAQAEMAARIKAGQAARAAAPAGATTPAEPGPSPIQAVVRDGKIVFTNLPTKPGDTSTIDYGTAASMKRSQNIAKALADIGRGGEGYVGALRGVGPGGIEQIDRIRLADINPAGGAASMMTALPGSEQEAEILAREARARGIEAEIAKAITAKTEEAKTPAEKIGEIAAAKAEGEIVGITRGRKRSDAEIKTDPIYIEEMKKIADRYDKNIRYTNQSAVPEIKKAEVRAGLEKKRAEEEMSLLNSMRGDVTTLATNRYPQPGVVMGLPGAGQ